MKNFADFLKANKEKIYEHAERNTRRNKNGDAVISREESWFDEDEWDDYYKEVIEFDDSTARSMVR